MKSMIVAAWVLLAANAACAGPLESLKGKIQGCGEDLTCLTAVYDQASDAEVKAYFSDIQAQVPGADAGQMWLMFDMCRARGQAKQSGCVLSTAMGAIMASIDGETNP